MTQTQKNAETDQVRELRALTRRLQNTLDEDSETISRELFDGLGQELSAIRYTIATLEERAEQNTSTTQVLNELTPLVSRALQAMCRVLVRFPTPLVRKVGLSSAVQGLLQDLQQQNCIETRLMGSVPRSWLDPDIEHSLYLAISEALDNVSKHSRASLVWVRFENHDSGLTIEVADNGIGLPKNRGFSEGSVGMIVIRERMTHIGGTAQWSSKAGHGTTLSIQVPLSDKPDS